MVMHIDFNDNFLLKGDVSNEPRGEVIQSFKVDNTRPLKGGAHTGLLGQPANL
jgi:hypothetical protein